MKKFDLDTVRFNTQAQKDRLKTYSDFLNDPKRDERREAQLCVLCYYDSRFAGQAFTQSECAKCQREMHFHTTSQDYYCQACAKEHRLCKHCGSDVELKDRKKL